MWAQLGAAALVIACGISVLTMATSVSASLERARVSFYERQRFPEVFTHLKRAPNSLRERIEQIPGISRVRTRVVVGVNLDVPGLAEPASGRIESIPDRPPYGLSELYITRGRLPEPDRPGEVVASQAFAEAHGFLPGATLGAIVNGRLEELTIVGIALSPEHVYQVKPGDTLPDDKRYGVFWMTYRELAPAFDMDGAFNDVVATLAPNALEADVLARLDRLTEPWGGHGAQAREDQESDKYLREELRALRTMSILPPTIFLSASAFILNIIFSRLIRNQREQIACLKAFGYGRLAIGAHYMEMALLVAFTGLAVGLPVGLRLGATMTDMYARFYRFPEHDFRPSKAGVAAAVGACLLAATMGAFVSVRRAASLPPAEAMRPEAPPDYRTTLLERLRLQRLFGATGRMVIRHIERQPLRASLSVAGIALAVAVLIVGSFIQGSLNYLLDYMFNKTQRQDMTITLIEPASASAIDEIARLPGVTRSEPFRAVPARLRAGHRSRLQGVLGVESSPQLNRVLDVEERPLAVPVEGLLLSDSLAAILGVSLGDLVTIEVLEGQRPVVTLPVAAIARTYAGTSAYMSRAALHRVMREGETVSGAALSVDPAAADSLYRRLKETPRIAGVTIKTAALTSFEDTIAESILRMRLINLSFAMVIAFGVIYNSARISLAERAHELATLRILGFTRGEVSTILLGELAVLTGVAVPFGMLLGRTLAGVITASLAGEHVRMPLVISPGTYAFAASVVAGAALISGLIVRRRVDRLDLIETLKTKG